ncbi:calcitonin gene-related peptide-receptor component protein-like protein, partial [Neoconidiobolus thromboides FSU 785]
MEVVNEHEAMLSNYEVLTIIEETSALTKQLKKVKKGENVSTIQFEVKKYLSELNSGSQSTEKVHNLLSALTEFQLTKAEKLQILNVAPSELVQLVVLVEDFEERFNEEEQQRLLEVIVEKL